MKDKNFYIKRIQKKMNDTLESGILKPEQEQQFINEICDSLIIADDIDINKTVKTYFDDLNKLDEDFKKTYKKYMEVRYEMVKDIDEDFKKTYKKYMEVRYEMVKDMCEEIKKL